jgi:hypothetical protein
MGMEDVASVGMHLDTGFRIRLAPHVSARYRTAFLHKNLASALSGASRHRASPDAGASYNQIYILHEARL